MRKAVFALGLALTFLPLPVAEATESITTSDGTVFKLEIPNGFCALKRADAKEKPAYDMQDKLQAAQNGVLLIAVSCDEIESVRAGKPWQRWTIWLLNGPKDHPMQLPNGITRDAVVAELVKAFPSIDLKQMSQSAGSEAAKIGLGLKLEKMSIIANDVNALYTAQTAIVSAGANSRSLAVVTGWAAFGPRLLTFNDYQELKGAETFEALLSEARDVLGRTMDAAAKP